MQRRVGYNILQTLVTLLCVILLISFDQPALAQVNRDKYQDLFLVGEFGEVCTMCEVIILCENTDTVPAYELIPAAGDFTLYHLQTRTFWSQIATIWEWFISNFNSESLAQGHDRPVWIYTVANSTWSGPETVDAWIALEPPLLTFGSKSIERSNQAWLDTDDATSVGYCQRLPLWESLETIEQKSGAGDHP